MTTAMFIITSNNKTPQSLRRHSCSTCSSVETMADCLQLHSGRVCANTAVSLTIVGGPGQSYCMSHSQESGFLNRESLISDSNRFKTLRIKWIAISIAIQCFQNIYTLNYYKHKLMETLNSVVCALASLLHALHYLPPLTGLHSRSIPLTDTFFEQPMCARVWALLSRLLMASKA